MKTRKMTILGIVLMALCLVSCTKPDDGNADGTSIDSGEDVEGYWAAQSRYDSDFGSCLRYPVYEFINNNTAIEYENVFNGYDGIYPNGFNSMPDHKGWYYQYKKTLTYTFIDNKIYFTIGVILTCMDGKFYVDNSSIVLSRWKSISDDGDSSLSQQDLNLTNKLKTTSWKFVKSITYYKSDGTTKTDNTAYGTISFRSCYDGDYFPWRVLTVNGKMLGMWSFKDGELKIGVGSNWPELTSYETGVLLTRIIRSGEVIEQLNNNTLVIVYESDICKKTFYYSKN